MAKPSSEWGALNHESLTSGYRKPLRTDFSFLFYRNIGQLRVVMFAKPNNSGSYDIALAARSKRISDGAMIAWGGSCQVDPFAQ